ncbi:lmbrd2 [Symbiodinium necroappetens]|uniref:Lmbrd2 protein n=1 Tax=Symbiodinium necroappetens TaxID=1628268 RepID=A0A812P9K3_9DINO|nr:lmbrd2 [Symbiodinium necroappetens]
MEFEASGDFTIATRLRTSIRRNAVFYVAYTAILCLLLIILIIRGEVQGDIQSWCIAASNAWGLFVLTVLMGFGLVAVPRHFWSLANPSTLLQDLYVNAVLKDEIRLSRLFELQDTVAQARSELAAHVELEEDAPGLHMQRLAFAKLCQVADRCEMLHRELSGCRISSPLVGTRSEKASGGHADLERAAGNVPLHPPPSLSRFAHLHRLLKAAALEARRASCCFDSHIERCIFFEDLQQGDHTAAANLLGLRHLALPALFPRARSAIAKLRRSLLTFWLRHLRARALLGLGWASCLLSAVVVMGQMTLFADGWHLSVLSLLFNGDYGPLVTQAFCLVPLSYVTYTAYFSIFRLKVSGWYGLYGNHNTDAGSLLWPTPWGKSGSPSGNDRDWCSQVNGARSIGVSSTGLSRSGHAANQSVVSSDSDSCQRMSLREFQSRNYLKDLKAFSDSLNQPMNIVRECMSQVDQGLLGALQITQTQAHDLVMAAQMVTWKLSATACNSLELLPTLLWAAKGHGDEKDVVGPISEVHSSIATMRKDAQTVRTSYIELLNQVRYLGQCAQVTLDEVIISWLPAPYEDESGSLETSPGHALDPTEQQRHSEKCLELALMHLDGLCMLLEDCSDFWLMLHSAELQLRKIEKEASCQ